MTSIYRSISMRCLSFAAATMLVACASPPVKYVVPFPPGGITDVVARAVAGPLAQRLGTSVVVEAMPGDVGRKAAAYVAAALPDGNTLLAATLSHAISAAQSPGAASQDFRRGLRTVALVAGAPLVILVRSRGSFATFDEFLAAAKSRPLRAGFSGQGAPNDVAIALMNSLTGGQLQHHKTTSGPGALAAALEQGDIDVTFATLAEAMALRADAFRALAITSARRHPLFPAIPTTSEVGLPAFQMQVWLAMMAPSATPDLVVEKIGAHVVNILADPSIADRLEKYGLLVDARGPADFAKYLQAELDRWASLPRTPDTVAVVPLQTPSAVSRVTAAPSSVAQSASGCAPSRSNVVHTLRARFARFTADGSAVAISLAGSEKLFRISRWTVLTSENDLPISLDDARSSWRTGQWISIQLQDAECAAKISLTR